MIISKISGGLGNQMFQYAIAKSITHQTNDSLKLDISFYPQQTLRKYELNLFNIEEDIASNNEIQKLAGDENIWFRIKRKLGINPERPKSYFSEKETTAFDKKVFEYENNIYLDGYWQNEKYFRNIRAELLKGFTLKDDISHAAKKYLDDIENTASVSLHVRRGDYVQNTHTNSVHGICDLEYYQKAIAYISKNIDSPTFYIFSDDINWCKDNFEFLENKVYIDDTKSAFDDFELMKSCRHNIIANSTFSWWGAWLNRNKDKIVISPAIWWSKRKSHIAPKEWIKL